MTEEKMAIGHKLYAIGVFCCEKYGWPLSDLFVVVAPTPHGERTGILFRSGIWTSTSAKEQPSAFSNMANDERGYVSILVRSSDQLSGIGAGIKPGKKKRLCSHFVSMGRAYFELAIKDNDLAKTYGLKIRKRGGLTNEEFQKRYPRPNDSSLSIDA